MADGALYTLIVSSDEIDALLGDFAQDIINGKTGATFSGIIDDALDGDFDPRAPTVTCKDSDLDDLNHGDFVFIGQVQYWIEGYVPDGMGMATIKLRRDDPDAYQG